MINTADELKDTTDYQPDLDSTIAILSEAELWDEIYQQKTMDTRFVGHITAPDGQPF